MRRAGIKTAAAPSVVLIPLLGDERLLDTPSFFSTGFSGALQLAAAFCLSGQPRRPGKPESSSLKSAGDFSDFSSARGMAVQSKARGNSPDLTPRGCGPWSQPFFVSIEGFPFK